MDVNNEGFFDKPKQEPVQHWSDCAVHREPAYPKGECDCGGYIPETPATEADLKVYQSIADNYFKDTQPKREWVGLTERDRAECWYGPNCHEPKSPYDDYAQAIEAKLKEKNT